MMLEQQQQIIVVGEDTTDWYQSLVDDCKAIITEAVFNSRWALVEGYHMLGERIATENNLERSEIYGKKILTGLSKSLDTSERTLYRAIQFYEKYPDLDNLPEGKNISWNKIITKYLSKPHVANNSGENEWYTPPEYIEAARVVMGRIDIDPASSDKANEIVQASRYYTKEDDGLTKTWAGKVWMNPPYSIELIKPFVSKYVEDVQSGNISEGIVLVNNATETNWFNELVSVSSAIVFTKGRVRFLDPDGNPGAPLQGQAIIYAGGNTDEFFHQFGEFGWKALL